MSEESKELASALRELLEVTNGTADILERRGCQDKADKLRTARREARAALAKSKNGCAYGSEACANGSQLCPAHGRELTERE